MRLVTTRISEQAEMISLCTLMVGGRQFGVETHRVREVLSRRPVQRVPLAPPFLGGIVSYRGDVLTAVSFRAVLGLGPAAEDSFVLVLGGAADEESAEDERFGLMVDSVGSVVRLERSRLAVNPSTLDERSRALFDGACKQENGLLVRLDVRKLRPQNLVQLYGEWNAVA